MNKQEKTAIVLGATGLTGTQLLRTLLTDAYYTKIICFSRRASTRPHHKIQEHVIDMMQLKNYGHLFIADVVFCCIGSTRKKTPDKELYAQIDCGIPVAAAELCKDNGIATFVVVSALGAAANSRFFYNRIKGEMEEKVVALALKKTHILQPSLIMGERQEQRIGEAIANQIMRIVNPILLGSLQKYRSISPEAIAGCMYWLSRNAYPQLYIPSDKIKHLYGLSVGKE